MAGSPGTWVKLGHKEWQYVPPLVRERAFTRDLTWDAAVEMTKCFRTEKPSNDAITTPGTRTSNPAQLKSSTETEGSTDIVELTPRSAVTEKVTSAIKLKDGRSVPVGDKASMPPPPRPGNFEDNAASSPPPPPPGNFGDKAASSPPLLPPPGNFGIIEAPPGNFDVGQQPPLPQGPAARVPINHGVAQFPINQEEEEEEGIQTTRSAPGVNTWWAAEDIRKYLKNETWRRRVEAMERLHLRQHHRLRQLAPRRGLHARSALQVAGATHDLRDGARAGDPPPTARLPREHQERQPLPEGAADKHS